MTATIRKDTLARNAPALRVVVSLDVEEEGLFSGRYASSGCGVRNVALLPRLAPLTRELGFPLTLFCAHTVFADSGARTVLARMRDQYGAEIAAHLHHWSTPPLGAEQATQNSPDSAPAPTDRLPRALLRQRLRSLLDAGRDFQSAPLTSFRMGRWDLKAVLRPLLAEEGITLDSSVCPLRAFRNGPDHFLAPADPYWAPCGPEDAPDRRLLEAPVTQVPLWPPLARLWHGLASDQRLDAFHFWGALSANPVWHSQQIMRMATRLHVGRGGKVLNLFWHSSEMLPGGSPHVPDEAAATALYRKIYAFLRWLRTNIDPRGLTAAQLRDEAPALDFPMRPRGPGDW